MNSLFTMITKKSLILFLCVISTFIYAQGEWVNQVYKADVPKIEYNPMKGLIPGYSGINSNFPYGADHFYIDLKSTYIGYDNYNWAAFEVKLNDAANRGVQTSPRFWIDYPNQTYGMPIFLQSLVPAVDYTNMGNTIGKSKLPDWNNETLLVALEKFIAAYGARYDGDPRIFMVEAGLYGFWGEWHNSGTSGKDMTQANKDRIINAYINAFKKTHIALRQANHPGTVDLAKKVGYYDDSFCYQTICTSGTWCFMYSLKGRGLTDNYKYHPMGGEVFPDTQSTMFDTWPNTQFDGTGKRIAEDITTSINETHMSVNKCFYIFKQQPTATQFANALRMHKMMGYQFFVHSVQMNLNSQKQLNVNVNLQNLGVAPFYYNWQVEFSAFTTKGIWIPKIGTADWNITSIYPSQSEKYLRSFTCTLPTAEKYYVMMRFKNPLDSYTSNAMQLRFANETQDAYIDGWLALGMVDVSTGLKNTEGAVNNQMKILYNASLKQLEIESLNGNMTEVSVYTIDGKLIYLSKLNSSKKAIYSNDIKANDMLIVKVISNNKSTVHKVIVR